MTLIKVLIRQNTYFFLSYYFAEFPTTTKTILIFFTHFFLIFIVSFFAEGISKFRSAIIVFDGVWFINGVWFPVTYFSFYGAILSRTFPKEKHSCCSVITTNSQILWKSILWRLPESTTAKTFLIAILDYFRFQFSKSCFHNSSKHLMEIC